MILLDTHVWVWWVHADTRLPVHRRDALDEAADEGLAVSVISCWEVAKLVEVGRLALPVDVAEWLSHALAYPGVQLLHLTPRISVESTRLPAPFHRDPADQIIVATARVHNIPVATADARIIGYPHVQSIACA